MDIEGISTSQIDSMLALLRKTAAKAAPPSLSSINSLSPLNNGITPTASGGSVGVVSFADTLNHILGQTNQAQKEAQQLGEQFAAGGNVSISDLLIAKEKGNISLQLTVQARNKLVEAYKEMMGMSI